LQEFASPPLSGASAEVSGFVNVLVTGGTGAGFLEACMTAFSDAGATGIATFGGVSYAGQSPAPCGGPFSLTEEYSISIIFGAPQVDEFSAQASATLDSAGGASFAGFQVFDSTGTLLSDATVAVTEAVPEPSALVPCLATIGLFYLAAKSGK
jgi:hypothetical protein